MADRATSHSTVGPAATAPDGARAPATVDIRTQYLKPADLGTLTRHAELIHLTGSTAFARAIPYDAAGDALAIDSRTPRLFEIGSRPKRSS